MLKILIALIFFNYWTIHVPAAADDTHAQWVKHKVL